MNDELHLDDDALVALWDESLEGDAHRAARAHLSRCARCAAALAAQRALVGAIRDVDHAPSAFTSARLTRNLEGALTREARMQRTAWRPQRVAAALAVAAFSGAALAVTVTGGLPRFLQSDATAAPVPAPVADVPAPAPAPVVGPRAAAPLPSSPAPASPKIAIAPARPRSASPVIEPPPAMVLDAPRADAQRRAAAEPVEAAGPPAPRVARASGTPTPSEAARAEYARLATGPDGAAGWVDAGDLAAMAGDAKWAAQGYARALTGTASSRAADRLSRMVNDGLLASSEVEGAIEARAPSRSSAEGMRLICEWRLRFRGDRLAVDSCRAFGREHPGHPAVRRLALAAGRVAEVRVEDLELAVEEYSRAILLSRYAGVPSTEALLARARCRYRLEEHDEARADLKLYLYVQPEAIWREDVRTLADNLGLAPGSAR